MFCLFLVDTWRSHIATLLKSTIGEHLQHDLKSEDCGEEIVKVAEDSAQKKFVRSLLEFVNIAGMDEQEGHMFCLHQILRREKSETLFSDFLTQPLPIVGKIQDNLTPTGTYPFQIADVFYGRPRRR